MPRFRSTGYILLVLFLLPAFAVAPQAALAAINRDFLPRVLPEVPPPGSPPSPPPLQPPPPPSPGS